MGKSNYLHEQTVSINHNSTSEGATPLKLDMHIEDIPLKMCAKYGTHTGTICIYNCTRAKNNFRQIALTSLVMKCFERLVKRYIVLQTQHLTGPLQFAYQTSRRLVGAILTQLHLLRNQRQMLRFYMWTSYPLLSLFNTVF